MLFLEGAGNYEEISPAISVRTAGCGMFGSGLGDRRLSCTGFRCWTCHRLWKQSLTCVNAVRTNLVRVGADGPIRAWAIAKASRSAPADASQRGWLSNINPLPEDADAILDNGRRGPTQLSLAESPGAVAPKVLAAASCRLRSPFQKQVGCWREIPRGVFGRSIP